MNKSKFIIFNITTRETLKEEKAIPISK